MDCNGLVEGLIRVPIRVLNVVILLTGIRKAAILFASASGSKIKAAILTTSIFCALLGSVYPTTSLEVDSVAFVCSHAVVRTLEEKLFMLGACIIAGSWFELCDAAEGRRDFSFPRLFRAVNTASVLFFLALIPLV